MWGLFGCCFVSAENVLVSWACQTRCICLCLCLAMASARLAAGVSQNGDRTRCLSGRRVAIVTMSASLRCFWETIPHPNQPVWVSAAGRSSFFPFPTASLLFPLFPCCVCSLLHLPFEENERSNHKCWPIFHCVTGTNLDSNTFPCT